MVIDNYPKGRFLRSIAFSVAEMLRAKSTCLQTDSPADPCDRIRTEFYPADLSG
ncbi:MAG: hypothetical protein KME57_29965 [Scytonema hyalinum WJT4-NPBG1]|nr:hypothetical protein [Scytonema hyalinum WJT4-NPBG1]